MIIVKRFGVHLTSTPRRLSRGATLVAALAAVLAITTLSPVSASAGAQPRPARTPAASALSFGEQQAALYPVQRTQPLTFQGSCTAVRRELPKLAREGVRKVACTQPAPVSSLPARDREAAALNLCVPLFVTRTRHASCGVGFIDYSIVDPETGDVLGTGLIKVTYQETLTSYSLSSSSWRWNLKVQVELVSAVDAVLVGTGAVVGIVCVNCTTAVLPWETPLPLAVTFSHTWSIAARGGVVTTTRQAPLVQIINPQASEQAPPVLFRDLGPARCDHSPTIPGLFGKQTYGCVFSDVAASYLVYLTGKKINNVAKNISDGETTKPRHFGWYRHGSPLTRANNGVVQDRNRQVACGRVVAHKPYSCDEYPFADTYQGAYYYPRDYVTKVVLQSENSREGAYRQAMYRSERLLPGDAYWVFVLP